MSKIVVGVDGSPCSDDALEWAYAQALATRAELVVVHCWEYPYLGVIDFVGMDERIRATSHDGAEALLDATITHLRAAHPDGDVTLTPVLLEGNPAWTILEAAKGADLIVVGSRGRSGLKTLLLGSVSHVVVTHADIPVVVVRHASHAHLGDE
ncbi:MAG TPA: universal stress protein [Ilumatobacteraceae bacterium]|nr:universal stress protein [Ilumatobacteraceae bacterium]